MIGLLCFVLGILASPFKSKIRLAAENAALRHQLIVLRRKLRGRVQLANSDRWFLVQLYRCFPSILKVLTIIRPETLVRWHRAGFRSYWRWKSRSLGGRPQIEADWRARIRRRGIKNPLCGAPFTENFSSSGLRWPNPASPSTWSSAVDRQARNGERSCVTTRRTLPRWICSLFRPLALACSPPSLSSVSSATSP